MALINSFFNKYLFFKFINKSQKEVLSCVQLFSHVCDFQKSVCFPLGFIMFMMIVVNTILCALAKEKAIM